MNYRDKRDLEILTRGGLKEKYSHVSFSVHTADELADPIAGADTSAGLPDHHKRVIEQPRPEDVPPLRETAVAVSLDSDEYREKLRAERVSTLAAVRYSSETGGIEVGGIPVKTDRESVALITSTKSGLEAMGGSVMWKAGDGQWVEVDIQMIKAIEAAVFTHIQRVRLLEHEKAAQVLEAQTLAELDAVDLYGGWDDPLAQLDAIDLQEGWDTEER